MGSPPLDNRYGAVLLDIEGTTTPISFVYDVLFPYAREHARQFIAARVGDEEVRRDIVGLYEENAEDLGRGLNPPLLRDRSIEPQVESIVAYLHWLMDHDRKSTPLKSLQGKIWEEGYRSGRLRSQVFADVPVALERWRGAGKPVSIYSSGSTLAQQLLFAYTEAGDLTRFIDKYFDTNTGPKREARSYARIAEGIRRAPGEIVFVSDVDGELDAAREAGLETRLCVRPANPPQANASSHPVVYSFDQMID